MNTERLKIRQIDHDLIMNNIVLVKKIAHHIMLRLPHHICFDDLVQAGTLGLIEASKNYNADKGASFSTYAGIRIHGSIIDEMRKSDWTPRSVHRNSRKILKAAHELEHILGRESSLSELATYLQIPIENLDRMMLDTKNSKIISFEEIGLGEDLLELTLIKENNPCHLAQHQEEKNNIVSLLRHLSERERLAIGLYYQEELTLKTIGHMLNISESRVSQIISQAITSLKQEWNLSFLNAAG